MLTCRNRRRRLRGSILSRLRDALPQLALQLDRGTRASSTSMTRSVMRIDSAAFLRAVTMCPGNQLIDMRAYAGLDRDSPLVRVM